MQVYLRKISEMNTNTESLNRVKRNLVRALSEDITQRQRECLILYYVEGLNMSEIGEKLGIDKSSVSRICKRGLARLRRLLRYGAAELLCEDNQND